MDEHNDIKWLTPSSRGRPFFSYPAVHIGPSVVCCLTVNIFAVDQAGFSEGCRVRIGLTEETKSLTIARTDDISSFRLLKYGTHKNWLVVHSRAIAKALKFASGRTYKVSSIKDGELQVRLTDDNVISGKAKKKSERDDDAC